MILAAMLTFELFGHKCLFGRFLFDENFLSFFLPSFLGFFIRWQCIASVIVK